MGIEAEQQKRLNAQAEVVVSTELNESQVQAKERDEKLSKINNDYMPTPIWEFLLIIFVVNFLTFY